MSGDLFKSMESNDCWCWKPGVKKIGGGVQLRFKSSVIGTDKGMRYDHGGQPKDQNIRGGQRTVTDIFVAIGIAMNYESCWR